MLLQESGWAPVHACALGWHRPIIDLFNASLTSTWIFPLLTHPSNKDPVCIVEKQNLWYRLLPFKAGRCATWSLNWRRGRLALYPVDQLHTWILVQWPEYQIFHLILVTWSWGCFKDYPLPLISNKTTGEDSHECGIKDKNIDRACSCVKFLL
jgi:hypothetical protein